MDNFELDLAESFVRYTNRNIFLTGKAGTGKTTFLKTILKKIDKNAIIVAPTGVAAINAGGMTIHSMFQLPLTAFIPSNDVINQEVFTNRMDLVQKQKIRKERRRVIAELELLVIDEISMVRSDLLDAIDYTLKRFRKNTAPFGGVQLLVIGDLFQLAPVIKEFQWSVLRSYYETPFFFSSQAWKQSNAITIELKKIYRQQDELFIGILNNIRNGIFVAADIEKLNDQFDHKAIAADIITLTTHNNKANAINETELRRLDTKEHTLTAKVKGQFSQSAYPTSEKIVLKKGAQVMFIRNHPEGLYFNGKIGIVTKVSIDELKVKCADDIAGITVDVVEWKNTQYQLDEETKKVEPKDVGSFNQYPLRLAWAVTVHKSQGLTFDKVIVDLENTFAPGQLYVALSRCRSLEGLALSSRISQKNIITDSRVKKYYQESEINDDIKEILQQSKKEYEDINIRQAFNLIKSIDQVNDWEETVIESELPQKADVLLMVQRLQIKFEALQKVALTFEYQLTGLMKPQDETGVTDRAQKGIQYFTEQVYNQIIAPIEVHHKAYRIKSKTKKYIREVEQILSTLWIYVEVLYKLEFRDKKLFVGLPKYKRVVILNPDGTTANKQKAKKGETQRITLALYKESKTLQEIADARNLKVNTIMSHMVKWIKEKEVKIDEFMTMDKVNTIWKCFVDNPNDSSSEVKAKIPFDTDYSELSMVRAWAEVEGKSIDKN
ncbi:MAG: helix-turn-helix domain-containing protein [Saprospiraceae bacterium]